MHCVIIANGNFLRPEAITEAIQNKYVIALDGAADKLKRLGLHPDVILGDFDSISASDWGITKTFHAISNEDSSYTSKDGITIVPAKNQLFTDLHKGLHYCDQLGTQSITIICATGGRLDHHEGSLRLLRRMYRADRPIILHAEQQSVRFLKDESLTINGEIGDKLGFLAYPRGSMTSQGLEFEAQNYALEFGVTENICNSLRARQATVHISGEVLAILPAMLNAQRSS